MKTELPRVIENFDVRIELLFPPPGVAIAREDDVQIAVHLGHKLVLTDWITVREYEAMRRKGEAAGTRPLPLEVPA